LKRGVQILCAVVLLGFPGSAAAHLGLKSSTPARNSTLTEPVREISVVFTQRVEAQFTDLSVTDANGNMYTGIISAAGTDGSSFSLLLPRNLYSGRYTVHWRAAGRDGHMVADSFHFTVDAPEPLPAASADPGPTTDPQPTAQAPAGRESIVSTPTAVVVRLLTFAAILLTIGSTLFRTAVLGRAAGRAPNATDWDVLVRATRGVAIFAAASVLVLLVPRLLIQAIEMTGSANLLEPGAFDRIVTGTVWGRGWMIQLIAGLICLYGAIRATEPTGWTILLIGSVLLAFSPAFSGHAAAIEQGAVITVASDALHVFAAAAWVGSLAAMFIVVLTRIRAGAPAIAGLVRCFSPLALLAAAVAVITGTVAALAHIGPLSDLWRTGYGRALSLKLAMFAGTASVGFINWRLIRPTLGTERGPGVLRNSSAVELVFAVLILLFTAVLVALPTP